MIILHVKKGGKNCGVLECDRGSFRFTKEKAPEFEAFLEESLAKGIPSYADRREGLNSRSFIEKNVIKKEDVEPYLLRDFLRHNGYIVEEIHPEIEREIRMLIEEVPDDSPDKKHVLEKLSGMTHLEQTAILEALRDADKGKEEDLTN